MNRLFPQTVLIEIISTTVDTHLDRFITGVSGCKPIVEKNALCSNWKDCIHFFLSFLSVSAVNQVDLFSEYLMRINLIIRYWNS